MTNFNKKYARWAPGKGPPGDLLRVLSYAEDGLLTVSVEQGEWFDSHYNVNRDDIVIVCHPDERASETSEPQSSDR